MSIFKLFFILASLFVSLYASEGKSETSKELQGEKRLVYIVSDTSIPFWDIMARGVEKKAKSLGYSLEVYTSRNDAKTELQFVAKALKENATGIILSPTTSLASSTILKLAKNKNIPVVICDIGSDGGEYVSYISSNNKKGAYDIGKVLAKKLIELGYNEGRVGIIAIPQKRLNAQARTAGFMQAMDEAGIKGADIKQQSSWSEMETYTFSKEMIKSYPDLRAIWLQGSNRYKGALQAIAHAGKEGKILLLTFDAEPEFLELIAKGVIVGSAMQQPYLMGQEAVLAMDAHLQGEKVEKNIQLPILAISAQNIQQMLPVIKKNVLGKED